MPRAKKKNLKQEELDQDLDILLEDESLGNGTITVIATIILTMVTISGIGYWLHLRAFDKQTDVLEGVILALETRIVKEVREDNTGAKQIGNLQNQLDSMNSEKNQLQDEKNRLEEELSQVRQQNEENQSKIDELNSQIETLNDQINAMNKAAEVEGGENNEEI